MIGFIDIAGLYFALTQLTHRNISQNHKFQAVGLGECCSHTFSVTFIFNCTIMWCQKTHWNTVECIINNVFSVIIKGKNSFK